MRIRLRALLLIAVALLTAGAVSSSVVAQENGRQGLDRFLVLGAELNGANEVQAPGGPVVGDPDGVGEAAVTLFEDGTVCWFFQTENLSTIVAAHIHAGTRGTNGPIVVDFAPQVVNGRAAGCVQSTVDLVTLIGTNPANYYVNVHTSEYRGGAIRGQLARGGIVD